MTNSLKDLVGLTLEEVRTDLKTLGIDGYRAQQVWHWIYFKRVRDFEEMTNLPKAIRQQLSETYQIKRPFKTLEQISIDGTHKWLFGFEDKREVETVYIPERERHTLCVSSQVGCVLSCTFCHTGTQRFVRNLTASEIIGQFLNAQDILEATQASSNPRQITNIVMMGMGEPLYNYDNVLKALTILMDPKGIGLSRRRITLSTSGVVPMIEKCGQELGVNLAISLHAVTNDLRDQLVPLNKKYPISELLEACRKYPGTHKNRRITFEYVMLKDINDSEAEAHALVKLLRGIPAKINLIPFNPWPGAPFECSSPKKIKKFSDILIAADYESPVRTPRGQDIFAACGQLKSLSTPEWKRKPLLSLDKNLKVINLLIYNFIIIIKVLSFYIYKLI